MFKRKNLEAHQYYVGCKLFVKKGLVQNELVVKNVVSNLSFTLARMEILIGLLTVNDYNLNNEYVASFVYYALHRPRLRRVTNGNAMVSVRYLFNSKLVFKF